jgi:hypothetical protein
MTTSVTDQYVAALRAMLTGDGEYDQLSAELQARDGARSGDVISALTGIALFTAARRRFPDGWTNADVVRLVGQVRARFADETGDIDPRTAEGTLRGALGDAAAAENLDKGAMAVAVPALLSVLLDQQGISGAAAIEAFLADVRPLADAWLARQQ